MPKVSVIMPVYNAEKYVLKAINSILNQTFQDFELIIIDDCGTDNSMNIVKDIDDSRIRVLSNDKNYGISYSRNKGIRNATGEYIALMDDDDIAVVTRLQQEVDFLDANRDIDAVGGIHDVIDENDEIIEKRTLCLNNPLYIKARLLFYDVLGNGTMMFRKSFVDNNGIYYKENCMGMEDYLFWIEFSEKGRISNIKDVLLQWRLHSENCTTQNISSRSEKYDDIRRRAFEVNGVTLKEESLAFLFRMLPEKIDEYRPNEAELHKLYLIFNELINNAFEVDVENKIEIAQACRKMYQLKYLYADMWKY